MTKKELQKEMKEFYEEKIGRSFMTHVWCKIYGHLMLLNQMEVLYLQCKCVDAKNAGEQQFRDFKKNHVVYDSDDMTTMKEMVWQECGNGKFYQTTQQDFFTADCELSIYITENGD